MVLIRGTESGKSLGKTQINFEIVVTLLTVLIKEGLHLHTKQEDIFIILGQLDRENKSIRFIEKQLKSIHSVCTQMKNSMYICVCVLKYHCL